MPLQSRLLQYRQIQSRNPPGHLPAPVNHNNQFSNLNDSNPSLETINNSGFQQLPQQPMYNPAYPVPSGHTPPPSSKYLHPEGSWTLPCVQQNHLMGQNMPYGVSQLPHRAEPHPIMSLQQQQQQQQQQNNREDSFHPASARTVSVSSLHSIEKYEARGPGRPLYQRRISATSVQAFPEDSNNPQGNLSQCKDLQDHNNHPSYKYTSPEMWVNANSSAALQNMLCNGSNRAVAPRDLLVQSKNLRPPEEHLKPENVSQLQANSFNYNVLQHLGQFPPLLSNSQIAESGSQQKASGTKPVMSYANALRAPPKPKPPPEPAKKNGDPLSLFQELSIGSSSGSNGYYSYFK